MTDFATLRARLDAAELAYLQRHGLLAMYEHGRPVKAEPRYRVTGRGLAMLVELGRIGERAKVLGVVD